MRGSIAPSQTRGQHRTHHFIETIHLRKYWQLFSSIEYFAILIRMWQASEWVFLAILQRRQEYDVKKSKCTTYNDPLNLFCSHLPRYEAKWRVFLGIGGIGHSVQI